MPRKTAQLPVQQPVQQLRNELKQQELRYEQRFDGLIAQLQEERAVANDLRASLQAARARKETIFAEAKALYERTVKECERLRGVLAIKQEVIAQLLPYYPHPLTPELQAQITLT